MAWLDTRPSSLTDPNTDGQHSGHQLPKDYDPSPDNAHRRSHSEIFTPSHFNPYALQSSTASSFQHRERRSSSWDLANDPDLRHKRRLASYKMFSLEGKVKSTVKKSFRWIKGKYQEIVHGFK